MDTIHSDGQPKKVQAIVIFQAGAAFAAYECGAFQVIANEMDKNQEELAVVAGTSSGGVNAAIVAKSYKDQQEEAGTATATRAAKVLKTFWTTVLPNQFPQLFPPYLGLQFPFVENIQRVLNVGTTLLLGNPHLFTPDLSALSPLAPYHFSASAGEKTLKEHFGTYEGCRPRLIIAAVNVQSGNMETFDSAIKTITPRMVIAGGSLPIAAPATKVDGEYYWDGGAWTSTPLGAVMNTLMSSSCDGQPSASEPIPRYKVYLVNGHPQQAPLPQELVGVVERMWDILVGDKTVYDIKFSERLNKYIELVQFLHDQIEALPPAVQPEVEQRYQEITGKQKWAILDPIVHLRRTGLPGDYWSFEPDFSRSRIEELIAQGERETQLQLETRESQQEEIESLQEEIKRLQAALAR